MPLILLVEDDAAVRRAVVEVLRWEDYAVAQAEDGRAALASARTDPPALVLSDIMMPVMDGVQLARALRADGTLCAIPIILYSAAHAEPDGIGILFDRFLTKPFALDDLYATLAALLGTPHA